MSVLRRREVRCFCARRPLLGVLVDGVDENIPLYFHVKSYKGNKLITETKFFSGEMHVCCRECQRWHQVILTSDTIKIGQLPDLPRMVDADASDTVISAPR